MQPEFVDRNGALVLELVRPLSTVLVLGVLPLGPYALLEEVVVGLEAKFGGRRDVVLIAIGVSMIVDRGEASDWTYIDAPEFFDGAEGNHLLEQIVPVVALGFLGKHGVDLSKRCLLPCHWGAW